jgi:diguanylate cyclase (GGDEF)-like protein
MLPLEGYRFLRGEDGRNGITGLLPEPLIRRLESIVERELGGPNNPFYGAMLVNLCVKLVVEFLLAIILLGFAIYDFTNGAYVSSFVEVCVSLFLFLHVPFLTPRLGMSLSDTISLSLIGALILIVTFEVFPLDSLVVTSALLFPVFAFMYKGKESVYWSVEFAVLHLLFILLSITYHIPQSLIVNNELWFRGSVPNVAYVIGSVYFIYFMLVVALFAHYVIVDAYGSTWRAVSSTDRLTGALNRVAFDNFYHRELARAERYSSPITLIIFDIDNFKCINDTYGHSTGDRILKEVAKIVADNIRKTDYLVRWGGEEFIVLCPNTGISDAFLLSEKLRKAIHMHDFSLDRKVTASFGVSELLPEDTADTFIDRADKALYREKTTGKNKVCMADMELARSLECDTL